MPPSTILASLAGEQEVLAPWSAVPWRGDPTRRCISMEAVFKWAAWSSTVAQARPAAGDGF